MLIALRGMPFTDELRAVPDVLNPGSDVSESSALRLVSGRLVICALVRLVATEGDCVCTTSALSPTTVVFVTVRKVAIPSSSALKMPPQPQKDHGGKFREERPKEGSHQ
jgi:hypothetical protein